MSNVDTLTGSPSVGKEARYPKDKKDKNSLPNEIVERIIFCEGPKKEAFDELLRRREVCVKWDLLIGNNRRIWKKFWEYERGDWLMSMELDDLDKCSPKNKKMKRYNGLFSSYYEWVTYERFGCTAPYCTNVATLNAIHKVKLYYCSDCEKYGPFTDYF